MANDVTSPLFSLFWEGSAWMGACNAWKEGDVTKVD